MKWFSEPGAGGMTRTKNGLDEGGDGFIGSGRRAILRSNLAARCQLRLSSKFQTNLSTAEAGCRSEHRCSRWPEGRGTGAEGSVRSACPSQKLATERNPGWRGGLGLLVPSMGPTPLRGASLRLSEFVPDKFVDCEGRMPKRTSAQPMARRARHGTCRVTWFASCFRRPKQKDPPMAGLFVLAGRLGFEPR